MRKILTIALAASLSFSASAEKIDASDPTKIYTFAGPGYKTTEFSNGDSLNEVRVMGNLGLSDNDTVMFEIGYGEYSGTILDGEEKTGITNSRARWFHLFDMDGSDAKGYKGWATQIDIQMEGEVKGTKGSNTVAIGALPAFTINAAWGFYLPINYISTWGEDFSNHQGHGFSIAPLVAYAPEKGLWNGFFVQVWPSYTHYVSGDLKNDGGASVDVTIGGSPTETVIATVTYQNNFDKDLNLYSPGSGPSGANYWNVFASAIWYF